jgi:hypothetical protein
MAVYKLSGTSVKNGRTEYSSFLAGNPAVQFTSYESIATATVTSSVTNIEFTSIPATYTHLQIRGIAKCDNTDGVSNPALTFNSDTGSNYAAHRLYGEGSTASGDGFASQTYIRCGFFTDSSAGRGSMFGSIVLDILDYKNTNKYKTVRLLSGNNVNEASAGKSYASFGSGLWQNTAAITSIKISVANNNFVQYSQFALYGIKGA